MTGGFRARPTAAPFVARLAILVLTATTVSAATPDDITGIWKTQGGDSHLELTRKGTTISGRIVWLKSPNYRSSKDGPLGTGKTDRRNPDPTLRSRSIIGLQVMQGFVPTGRNQWGNGTCYNPESGKSYRCRMRLTAPGRLDLRGYVGLPAFGRSFSLSR